MTEPQSQSRRTFLSHCGTSLAVGALQAGLLNAADEKAACFQAMGTRVGDVTSSTAIVWARVTQHPERNNEGLLIPGRANGKKELPEVTVPVPELEGACPGQQGEVRIRYGLKEDLSDAKSTGWAAVDEKSDFIHQFHLTGLKSGQQYYYASDVRENAESQVYLRPGRFRTAPEPGDVAEVRFCVMTCQGYPDRGHPDGHPIYPAMGEYNPDFTSLTGDLVYYDNDLPRAVTPELGQYHWQRMFSLPRLVEFNSNHSTYWLKDDHDTLKNDSWPGAKMGTFDFVTGQEIFRQQAPMQDGPAYRTFRWGKDLQIWLSDGRDYRSPNNMPDGPKKTIWGEEQKAWFKQTVQESDAAWKILISPTPFVGPDRTGKNDNHANGGFTHEGDELRHWIREYTQGNFAVICGDRHWQYHSIHPETGLHEFSVGAASNEHAGGTPGLNPEYHQFHRVKGGFLSVHVFREGDKPRATFEHRDIDGAVVYSYTFKQQ
ncbi:MAG: alkaline phosphatase D family protein [Planctomycetaceae bacterium]|nr:alkaline phosphatase D family protein [Planctomycetaceae bacterium]MCB9951977.1 alkaline phosphatase D family protein [Planctomycetaceae bacterium]